jgi:hypothetical protein
MFRAKNAVAGSRGGYTVQRTEEQAMYKGKPKIEGILKERSKKLFFGVLKSREVLLKICSSINKLS